MAQEILKTALPKFVAMAMRMHINVIVVHSNTSLEQ